MPVTQIHDRRVVRNTWEIKVVSHDGETDIINGVEFVKLSRDEVQILLNMLDREIESIEEQPAWRMRSSLLKRRTEIAELLCKLDF